MKKETPGFLKKSDEGFDNIFACFCRQKSKKQPVFELVAADVHRTSAFKWVRIPISANKKPHLTVWFFVGRG